MPFKYSIQNSNKSFTEAMTIWFLKAHARCEMHTIFVSKRNSYHKMSQYLLKHLKLHPLCAVLWALFCSYQHCLRSSGSWWWAFTIYGYCSSLCLPMNLLKHVVSFMTELREEKNKIQTAQDNSLAMNDRSWMGRDFSSKIKEIVWVNW